MQCGVAYKLEEIMQIYQCPNCGRTYTEFQNVYYCGNCNYRLIKQEDIKKIRNPELSKREYNVVEIINDPTKPTVECPYCHSKNTKKISGLSKAGSVALWGIFALGKTAKQFHCINCGADF